MTLGRAARLAILPVAAGAAIAAQSALPAPPILSPESVEILEQMIDGEPLQQLELRSRVFFFPTLSGDALSVVGFRVGREGLLFGARDDAGIDADGMPVEVASVELFGALLQDGAEVRRLGSRFMLPRAAFAGGISASFSFAETLPAGHYELVWGLRDEVSGKAAARRENLEVPALGATGLQLSSVLVAPAYRPAQGAGGSGVVAAGVRVFTASFDDDLERTFDRAATPEVSLTFIAAGASPDPVTRVHDLEVEYRVLDEEGRSVLRLPPQASARMTISQPIPIARAGSLEPGREYRFEITVRDRIAGTETTRLVPFRLRG